MENMLFRPNERLLVEEKFLDLPAYDFLKGACERVMSSGPYSPAGGEALSPENAGGKAALHPAELFYQCFFIIDTLKCKTSSLRAAYCNGRVWNELISYFRDEGYTLPLEELGLVAGCIVLGAAELLLRAGMEHLSSVNALTMQLQHYAPSSVAVLVGAYRMSGRTVDEEELARMMGEYMASDRMYSQDINDLLDSQENAVSESSSEGLSSGFPQEATATAGFVRIAPRKKTSVLVVLNAMYKAGWFVDADGGELTNRDAVLNDILNHAFGIDKATAISQTINPSNNINGNAKNELLLRRLLVEDEMESFISDLQQELLHTIETRENG